ncbi:MULTISPECIES: radical SAM protein [Sutcliffiella]|uniref:Uncharacterized protein n=1 Tax=Sutcliffiella cohnii TaxID=33932 RepID=A0A223KVS7_9BACI|nr:MULTISPECIES: radical SAM protein [Sutcliffiella]AST93561.1 hypothetical protein BC6307_20970 [Sutcliffiella cohnii]WBL14749.1 radical SAM protein [Sutcliffiella sp. NC1]
MSLQIVEEENKVLERINDWYDHIPMSVNDTYGDPFIIEQVDNTIKKLKILWNHKAPIAIFTKAPFNPEVIEKLKEIKNHPQVIVMYSLTGLNEAGYSFENRVNFIKELKEIFNDIVILTRPIIKGRNDDEETLQKIVQVAKEHCGYLVLGGLHDPYKNKKIESTVEERLIEMCDMAGVKSFHKSSCCAAYIKGVSCWMHDLNEPINLDVARALGYEFEIVNNSIVLNSGSTGDLNFLRMLTRANIYSKEIISNYNLLTIKTGTQKYESTSSWYAWAENIETCLDCDYCIIKQIEYLKKMRVQIGTHPRDMLKLVAENNYGQNFEEFKRTKIKKDRDLSNLNSYADVRITKPCFAKRY